MPPSMFTHGNAKRTFGEVIGDVGRFGQGVGLSSYADMNDHPITDDHLERADEVVDAKDSRFTT